MQKISKEAHSRESLHESVLLQEVVEGVRLPKGGTFVDATINGGGHSRAVVEQYGSAVTLLGIDADSTALLRAKARLAPLHIRDLHLVESNFRHLKKVLGKEQVSAPDAILFDLGLSSDQFAVSGRGFSFEREEPLLMTFSENPESLLKTAYGIVNHAPLAELERIFKEYAEEPHYRHLARAIVIAREQRVIDTAAELAAVIAKAMPRKGKTHPATRAFQALRIAVNDELGALTEVLPVAFEALAPNGRLLVISFHSGEDRIVKRYFQSLSKDGQGILLTKKPIVPTRAEILRNPRSRSAKLRIIEKTN